MRSAIRSFASSTAPDITSSIAVAGRRLVDPHQGVDGHGGGEVTGGRTAHPVGDDEQVRARVARVLVVLADETDLGVADSTRSAMQRQGSSRRIVRPMRTTSAKPIAVGLVIRWLLT